MVKYFLGQSVLRSSWDQVFAAFWQRYPNPYRYVAVGRASRPPLRVELGGQAAPESGGHEGLDSESGVGWPRNCGHS